MQLQYACHADNPPATSASTHHFVCKYGMLPARPHPAQPVQRHQLVRVQRAAAHTWRLALQHVHTQQHSNSPSAACMRPTRCRRRGQRPLLLTCDMQTCMPSSTAPQISGCMAAQRCSRWSCRWRTLDRPQDKQEEKG